MVVILKTLVCVGMLTVAGLRGVALGYIEKKVMEEEGNRDFYEGSERQEHRQAGS